VWAHRRGRGIATAARLPRQQLRWQMTLDRTKLRVIDEIEQDAHGLATEIDRRLGDGGENRLRDGGLLYTVKADDRHVLGHTEARVPQCL
jgi:hypothetical protein